MSENITYGFRDILVIPDKYNTGVNNINMEYHELAKPELTDDVIFVSQKSGVSNIKLNSEGSTWLTLNLQPMINSGISGEFLLENCDLTNFTYIRATNAVALTATNKITLIFKNCIIPIAEKLGSPNSNFYTEFYNCTFNGMASGSNTKVINCQSYHTNSDAANLFANCYFENYYVYDIINNIGETGDHMDGIQLFGSSKSECGNIIIKNYRFSSGNTRLDFSEAATSSTYVGVGLFFSCEHSIGENSIGYHDVTIKDVIDRKGIIYTNIKNGDWGKNIFIDNYVQTGKNYISHYKATPGNNNITLSNWSTYNYLYVSSVWKSNGKINIVATNDTSQERKLKIVTNKGEKIVTFDATITDLTQCSWHDWNVDTVIEVDDADYVVCYDITDSNDIKQIRYVNFTNDDIVFERICYNAKNDYPSYIYDLMMRRRMILSSLTSQALQPSYVDIPTYLTEVDYVDSTGYSWIDTGYNTISQNTSIECKVKGKNTSASEFGGYMYGVRPTTSGTTNCFLLYDNKTNYSARFSDGSAINFSTGASYNSAKGITVINQNKTCITMNFEDGTSVQKTWTVSDFTNNQNFYIGGCNVAGEISAAKSWHRWYYFKIWDNGTLVRYLIPIYNSTTQRFGFFDKVNGVEYYNTDNHDFTGTVPTSSSGSTSSGGSSSGSTSGGGTSSGGSSSIEVLPDGYTLVKAVKQAQGNYIDLGIKADYNTKIGVMHNLFVNNNNYYSMFGYQSGDNNRMMISNTIGVMNLYFLNKTITATLTPTSATTSDTVCTTYFDNSQFTLDLVNADGTTEHLETAITPTNTTGVTGENLFLGRASTSGGSAWSYGSTSGFTWYGCKIWQGSELVRYLAPCLDSSNVACFYDFVGKQTYYPVTGSFSYIAL